MLKFYFSKCLKIQDKVKRRHARRLVDLYAAQAQPKKTHTGLAFQNKLIQNMEKKCCTKSTIKEMSMLATMQMSEFCLAHMNTEESRNEADSAP